MSTRAEVRSGPEEYRDLSGRPQRRQVPGAGPMLAVAGVLAVVTFTLVYLTTLSYATGF